MDRAEKKALMYKMRKYRASLSKDDRERVQAYDRDRKARLAAEMTEEEKAERKEKDRIRKALQREEQREREGREKGERKQKSLITWDDLKENQRKNMRKLRETRSQEEVEYDNLKAQIGMRKFRQSRTKEKYTQDKIKAKEGMRNIGYYGFIREECTRSKTKFKDVDRLWRTFWEGSSAAKKLLKEREPEIAERLEEEDRREPDIASRLAAEDLEREAEKKKSNAARIKAWREKKRLKLQKLLDEPIVLPELEKSEYEKIRDENVRQLEEARKALFATL